MPTALWGRPFSLTPQPLPDTAPCHSLSQKAELPVRTAASVRPHDIYNSPC